MADAEGELLVVLVDTTLLLPPGAGAAAGGDGDALPAHVLLQQLLTFLKAHQLLSEHNHQCVIAVHSDSSPVIYTPTSTQDGGATMQQLLLERFAVLLEQQQQQQQQLGGTPQQQQQQHQPEAALSAALSRALCYCHRHAARYGSGGRRRSKPRVLCLVGAAGSDTPLQYIPMMNAIFAAQGGGVVLDALLLGCRDSAFLQQACHLTGGVYARPPAAAGLLQQLLVGFAADTATREVLVCAGACGQVVDYRASCFCHKAVVDTGYICSVCLSIFCKANMKLPACPTCGSAFKGRGGGAAGGAAAAGKAAGAAGAGQQQAQQQGGETGA